MSAALRAIGRHPVPTVYLLSLLWLAMTSGFAAAEGSASWRSLLLVLAIMAGALVAYLLLWRLVGRVLQARLSFINTPPAHTPGWVTAALVTGTATYIAIVSLHYLFLNSLPLLQVLSADSDIAISVIRQEGYFGLPLWMRYASDLAIKSLGPLLLILTAYFRSRLFWFVLAAGSIYTTMLVARILPAIFLMPLVVYYLMIRQWLRAISAGALMLVLVVTVTTLSSTSMRAESFMLPVTIGAAGGPSDVEADSWMATSPIYALLDRIMLVPGRVTEQWFSYYRNNPLEGGCAYQRLAPLLGCPFVNVPTKLYAHFYPENVAAGMNGSLNAATFMLDYANFGEIGFVASAVLGALLMLAVTVLFSSHPLALPLNLSLLLSLMETNLFTALGSGSGWLLTTSVFILLFRRLRRP